MPHKAILTPSSGLTPLAISLISPAFSSFGGLDIPGAFLILIIVLNFISRTSLAQLRAHFNMVQASTESRQETRCECGQLIAKLRPEGVELKCKRCKRLVLIPYSQVGDTHVNI